MPKSRVKFVALGAAVTLAGLAQVGPAAAEIKTQAVDYQQGGAPLEGYLAYDDKATGKRPAVLIIYHRDGLDDFTKDVTRKIAAEGYVAFAADIFGKGVLPKNTQEAIDQSTKFNNDRPLMRARAKAGLDELAKNPMVDTSHIATLGYCFGGTVVVELAETGVPVAGTVSIHGSFRDFTPDAAKNVHGRVLILHGSEDPVAPLSEVNLLVNELRKANVDFTLELYGGAHHGFSQPKGPVEARADARSIVSRDKFFAQVLK